MGGFAFGAGFFGQYSNGGNQPAEFEAVADYIIAVREDVGTIRVKKDIGEIQVQEDISNVEI